jgi:hypothetical protein
MADVLTFLQEERGLSEDTLKRFGVELADNGGARFQFPYGWKIRYHRDDGTRHFASEKGKILGLFGWHEKDASTAFIVEGETDAMRLWQELQAEGAEGVSVFGIPGVNTWRPEFSDQFRLYDQVYVVLDNDDDYKVAATVDKCWRDIRLALGKKAKRITLPQGVNDLCEFFDAHNMDTLRMLADRKVALWHYDALDLMVPPAPPDWLVDELICRGDITMMIGEPGVGKSWLSMSLAVAVAEGHQSWLGRKVDSGNQRVLYVDEENPEALITLRLRKLGLSDEGINNVRYLHRQGVRLDRHPDRLLDEALDWEPTLIVLDSLTRLHTKDENNAGEVAGLFNDGVVPLARETGATTLILHHVNKGDGTSSFSRARGSGDLSASIDSGLDVRASDLRGGVNVYHYKSRWIAEGSLIRAEIADTPDGHVAVITNDRPVF